MADLGFAFRFLRRSRAFAARFLFGLDATNPATIGAAVIVLGLAAAAAAFLPAHRASGTDPLIALRAE